MEMQAQTGLSKLSDADLEALYVEANIGLDSIPMDSDRWEPQYDEMKLMRDEVMRRWKEWRDKQGSNLRTLLRPSIDDYHALELLCPNCGGDGDLAVDAVRRAGTHQDSAELVYVCSNCEYAMLIKFDAEVDGLVLVRVQEDRPYWED